MPRLISKTVMAFNHSPSGSRLSNHAITRGSGCSAIISEATFVSTTIMV